MSLRNPRKSGGSVGLVTSRRPYTVAKDWNDATAPNDCPRRPPSRGFASK
jgi:hypothetical protein